MIVVVLERCPLSLRGDLTRWLSEISTEVYVGSTTATVRDRLWERIKESIHDGKGRAIMVFTTNNEQGYSFRTHNTNWVPEDFDGLTLIVRKAESEACPKSHIEDAVNRHKYGKRRRQTPEWAYVALDVETTGLSAETDKIIEIGAVKHVGEEWSEWSTLIYQDCEIPETINQLTGIRQSDIADGQPQSDALRELLRFCGNLPIVVHNATFDCDFINEALLDEGYEELPNRIIDTLEQVRKKYPHLKSYKLQDLARLLLENGQIGDLRFHRALDDAKITAMIYEHLLNP